MRVPLLLLSLFWLALANATTWTVNINGPGDFTVIQTAIETAVNGDTVLVYLGRYIENLDFLGKSPCLYSLEATTGDRSYIENTIIDGGGGVLLYQAQLITIQNDNILDCISGIGGGLCVGSSSTAVISGVRIKNSTATMCGGGVGIESYQTQVTFDADNLCSIYNNHAAHGMDLAVYGFGVTTPIAVVVDTFTVANPEQYYGALTHGITNPFTYSIQHAYLTEVEQDMYVAPWGDDANSGLNEFDPLYSPWLAVSRVASNAENPHTVHLAAGTYTNDERGHSLPLSSKPWVIIAGAGSDCTFLEDTSTQSTVGSSYTGGRVFCAE